MKSERAISPLKGENERKEPLNHAGIVKPPFSPAAREILAAALRQGRVMAYPTETVYALGGNALKAGLVAAIHRLKGRPPSKPLPLLIGGMAGLEACAQSIPPAALRLVELFWPGPLTMVFRASSGLPAHLPDARGTVALRCSSHPLVTELLRIGGAPLIGTSANRGGEEPARGLDQVRAAFGEEVALAVDGGPLPPGPPSTLLDVTVLPFRLLRVGAIKPAQISTALSEDYPKAAPNEN